MQVMKQHQGESLSIGKTARRAAYALGAMAGLILPYHGAQAGNGFTLEQSFFFESVGDVLPGFQNGLEIGEFYNIPSPLPPALPGTVVKKDPTPFTGYVGNDLYGPNSIQPTNVDAYRFIYHSLSTTGRDVASSAVVFIPKGTPPIGGWPVIAWAHGTAGVAKNCAPSAMKDVLYGDTDLFGFMDSANYPNTGTVNPNTHGINYDNYAVVATDYAGLGTNSSHEYLSRLAHGHDVINSVTAARKAFPGLLSKKWVTVGHSQGGEASLGVAELESTLYFDPNYLGAVAVAPLTYLTDTIKGLSPGQAGYIPFIAHGVKSLFPTVKYEDLMTPAALNLLFPPSTAASPMLPPAAPDQALGCIYTAGADDGFGNNDNFGTYDKVLLTTRGKGINHPALLTYSALNEPGTVRATKPIFIAQGVADEVIPVATTNRAAKKLCSIGDKLLYKTYPLDPTGSYGPHTWAVYQSFDDQMQWIQDRFAGKPAPSNCI